MKTRKINKRNIVNVLLVCSIALLNFSCKKTCRREVKEKVYVANEAEGTITIFDADSYEILKTVDLTYKGEMYMPHNVQVAPDGETIWATGIPPTEGADEMVIVLRGKYDKEAEHINVGGEQHLAHVIVDDESKFAYVTAKEKGQVIQIDVDKMKEVRRFDLGEESGPHGLRYMNGKLYVACMASQEMIQVDVETGDLIHIPVGGIAVQTAVIPSNNSAYVSVYTLSQVVKYDISTGSSTIIQLPIESQGPVQLYPSLDGKKLYVCDQGLVAGKPVSNKLYIINTETNTVESTVIVGQGSHGVTINSDGSKIYVTNVSDFTVSVVDAVTLNLIKTISVGELPNGISIKKCKTK